MKNPNIYAFSYTACSKTGVNFMANNFQLFTTDRSFLCLTIKTILFLSMISHTSNYFYIMTGLISNPLLLLEHNKTYNPIMS